MKKALATDGQVDTLMYKLCGLTEGNATVEGE